VEGSYTATYPGGFGEEGAYRVVFYARDRSGVHAPPRLAMVGEPAWADVYLPLVIRDWDQ